MTYLGGQGGYFEKLSQGSKTWLEALSDKMMSIQIKIGGAPTPRTKKCLGGKGGYFEKLSCCFETSDMTS